MATPHEGEAKRREDVRIINTDKHPVPDPAADLFLTRALTLLTPPPEEAPLVSIIVVAYNRLDQTRVCVECILRYTTDIPYELILVDNGSLDGTLDYFKSLQYPSKKVIRITKNIGSQFGWRAGINASEGLYLALIANDIYVTQNWLSNMLTCIQSDLRVGMVVPLTSNVSNFQQGDLVFDNFEEMQRKAAAYNVSDPRKWHERIRLSNPLSVLRRECLDVIGTVDLGFCHEFADDDLAFRVRRAGYKIILCRDTFVHHDHDLVKGRDTEEQRRRFETGKIKFQQKYRGLDAWDDVNNYEPSMMSLLDPASLHGCQSFNILGVDVKCGTPLLELKNKLREGGIYDVTLFAFTSEAKYYLDLKTICEGEVYVDRPEFLADYFEEGFFDFIVIGKAVNRYRDPYKLLQVALSKLKDHGHLFVKLINAFDARSYLYSMGNALSTESEPVYKISLDDIRSYLKIHNHLVNKVVAELHVTDEPVHRLFKEEIGRSKVAPSNREDVFMKLMTQEYVMDIRKRGGQQSSIEMEIAGKLHQQAIKLYEIGKTELAIKQLKMALEVGGDHAEIHNDLGVLYYHEGKEDLAIDHLLRAVRSQPENTEYKENLAFIFLRSGRYNTVCDLYKSVMTPPQKGENLPLDRNFGVEGSRQDPHP